MDGPFFTAHTTSRLSNDTPLRFVPKTFVPSATFEAEPPGHVVAAPAVLAARPSARTVKTPIALMRNANRPFSDEAGSPRAGWRRTPSGPDGERRRYFLAAAFAAFLKSRTSSNDF